MDGDQTFGEMGIGTWDGREEVDGIRQKSKIMVDFQRKRSSAR